MRTPKFSHDARRSAGLTAGIFILAAGLAALPATSASSATLGPATGYGAFVFENFTSSYSDTELNLAAGGAVALEGYSVGQAVSPGVAALLAAGGNVAASNGQVGPGGQGAIRAGGSITGTMTAGGGKHGGSAPFDVAKARTSFETSSRLWAGYAANGTVTDISGTLKLSGADSNLNVFNISADAWNGAGGVDIDTPVGSTNLINIAGQNVTFANGQITINGGAGPNHAANATTLYNLFEATSLTLPGSKAPQGTVVAAFADVVGGWGQLNGQLIAKSFLGHTQINRPAFDGGLAITPLPAAFPLLAAGLAGLGYLGARRRRGADSAAAA